jgi:hypothetical protein
VGSERALLDRITERHQQRIPRESSDDFLGLLRQISSLGIVFGWPIIEHFEPHYALVFAAVKQ